MFINAVGAVGNYDEIYKRHMEAIIPRRGINMINNGTSGRMYSHPFGNLFNKAHIASPGHEEGGQLEAIFERGYLKCGIIDEGTTIGDIDEEYSPSGMTTDYCYALSTGIFRDYSDITKHNRTQIFSLNSADATTLLNKRELDIIGLVEMNLANDISGNMSFSEPIYYNNQQEPLALATSQDDAQWASFVYWTVSSTIYAEEKNITQSSSSEMPLVNLFGPYHIRMMRNIINAVGNYGDIYDRNIDTLGPRDGLNMLNSGNGPQYYASYPPTFYNNLDNSDRAVDQEF
eukprot:15367012-Ditylum_brightwellii.AAC.1